MIGAICGDIIGSVFEHHNVKSEDFELFSRYSRFTDDTVLTVAVADKLLSDKERGKPLSGPDAAKAYAARFRLYYSRHKDAGYGQMFSGWAEAGPFKRQKSYGNGGAMRAVPIGYAFDELGAVLKEARLSCLYTHNHPEAIRGAKVVAGCVFLARTGAAKGDVRKFAEKMGYNLGFTLDDIRRDYEFNSRASYSVPPAIAAFLESEDYESAVRKAVSIGGDSDTIACIAGGVAHAFYKHIPKHIYSRCMLLLDSGLKKTTDDFVNMFEVER
ncbi:MAG: ADP-ribosylglycohydrolase family protein [Oscillospiraceae bacterium]|nr:ADP-ribosylglycohydrolase family protein [Oscillospiraceae bacterium]